MERRLILLLLCQKKIIEINDLYKTKASMMFKNNNNNNKNADAAAAALTTAIYAEFSFYVQIHLGCTSDIIISSKKLFCPNFWSSIDICNILPSTVLSP